MDLAGLQERLEARYGEGDEEMGLRFLALVLVEEVGELAEAVRRNRLEAAGSECVDVAFMALSLANRLDVDLDAAIRERYLDRPLEDVTGSWTDVTWRGDPEEEG